MGKFISKTSGFLEAAPLRSALIRFALAIMVIGTIASSFIPDLKNYVSPATIPLLWLTAFLTLSELIAIRKAVEAKESSAVFSKVNKFILSHIYESKRLEFFLGEDSSSILNNINDIAGSPKSPVKIFFSVCQSIPDRNNLNKFKDASFNASSIVYSSSFLISHNDDETCSIYMLGDRDTKCVSIAELDNREHYAEQLISLASNISRNSIQVTQYSEPILRYIASESSDRRLDAVRNEKLRLINSPFFKLASEIAANAEKSLLAVDFISPSNWANEPLMSVYIASHKSANGEKKRVHIYEKEKLGSTEWKIDAYEYYCNCMEEASVEVRFLDITLFDRSRFEARGSLVIDGEIVAEAINAIDGAPFGELSYSKPVVDAYTTRFHEVWSISENKESFFELLKKIETDR